MRVWSLGLGLLSSLSALGGLASQDNFTRLYEKAEAVVATNAEARRQAFLVAFEAFSKLPVGGVAYGDGLLRGATSALRAGRFSDAIDLSTQEWKRSGPASGLLTLRLEALAGAGMAGPAVDFARKHEKTYPDGVAAWMSGTKKIGARMAEADQLLLSGETAAGVWLFESLRRVYPGEATLCANLALTNRRLGRLDLSEAGYRAALKLAPQADWLWTDYGLLLKGQGKLDATAKAFVEGLRHEDKPGISPAGTNLGVLAVRVGKNWGRDPLRGVTAVVRTRPRAAMARRVLLDLLSREVK